MRSRSGVRGVVLTTAHQLALLSAGLAVLCWTALASVILIAAVLRQQDHGRTALAQRLALQRTAAAREIRLIGAAETLARERTARLRLIFGAAGMALPADQAPARTDGDLLGGDAASLARALDVDAALAARIQSAARAAAQARALAGASLTVPLGRPAAAAWSQDFGVRRDPFTGRPAFHPGVDIPAPRMTPIYATAQGVVTFTGLRSGYGSTVEVDHGEGLMTRFAHLAAISVKLGQRVDTHTRLGAVGSSGRSTGPHLHYEIWRNGRAQDPGRFLRAGDYVQQAG